MKLLIVAATLLLFACNDLKVEPKNNITQKITGNEEETLKAIIKQFPDSIVLMQNLAAFYTERQNYDAALAQINSAIAKDSANPILRDNQSTIYAIKGDTANAIKSLNKALEIFPEPQYIIALGALYAQTKNPLALDMADALLIGTKAGAEKEAYFIKGLYYSFANEKQKAIPFFDKAIAVNYTFMDAYLEKAIAQYDLAKFTEAATTLEKAVALQNNFDRGYFYLGQCYQKLNRKDDAIEAYQLALVYDPNYEEAKDALSKLGVR